MPEKLLWSNVLFQACYEKDMSWIENNAFQVGSFLWICHELDLEPENIRKQVKTVGVALNSNGIKRMYNVQRPEVLSRKEKKRRRRIASTVRYYRKKAKLRLKDLDRLAGVGGGQSYKLEKANLNLTPERILKFERALNVSLR